MCARTYQLRFQFQRSGMTNYIHADDAAAVLSKGTIIHLVAWHDNTAANRKQPGSGTMGAQGLQPKAHLDANRQW